MKKEFENSEGNDVIFDEKRNQKQKISIGNGNSDKISNDYDYNSLKTPLNEVANQTVLLSAKNLEVITPDQRRILLENLNLEIYKSNRMLINGPSGFLLILIN